MMNHSARRTTMQPREHSDFENIRKMLPYVGEYSGRVMFALLALIISKAATVGV